MRETPFNRAGKGRPPRTVKRPPPRPRPIRRRLLVLGNGKLGSLVYHFSLPPVRTCPGSTALCRKLCYARHGHYHFPNVQEALAWRLTQTYRGDFADRIAWELLAGKADLMRWHVAGDLYSPSYAYKVLDAIQLTPGVRHWIYTRSWRQGAFGPVLGAIAAQKNARVWYSADEESGPPKFLPRGVKVAWMHTPKAQVPKSAGLVFLPDQVQRLPLPLTVLNRSCPTDDPRDRSDSLDCRTCGECWR